MTRGAGGPLKAAWRRPATDRGRLAAEYGRPVARATAVLFGCAALAAGATPTAGTTPTNLAAPVRIQDGGIAQVLPGAVPGDAARGRAIVASRQVGLCLLCHSGPIPEERFQGDLATNLTGAGDRSTEPQLRLRIVDASRLNPDTIMPSYYRTSGLNNVAAAFKGKPILQAQQIEDVVAYLQTLKGEIRNLQGETERSRQATSAPEASQ